jgi:hypothetical protein
MGARIPGTDRGAGRVMRALTVALLVGACSPAEPPAKAVEYINVAVIVDGRAPQTPRADIERVLARASAKLIELRGVGLQLTEIVYGAPRAGEDMLAVRELANTFIADRRKTTIPDGIVVLTDEPMARSYGGYSDWATPPFPFRNRFPSPRPELGGDKVYLMVVHFDHMYARCGYNDALEHVSDVAINGECRNKPGTPCVESANSRWVCSDATGDAYSTPDVFRACTVAHELAHAFGFPRAMNEPDHLGTPDCVARVGIVAANPDLAEFQRLCAMCPDVYTRIPEQPR